MYDNCAVSHVFVNNNNAFIQNVIQQNIIKRETDNIFLPCTNSLARQTDKQANPNKQPIAQRIL